MAARRRRRKSAPAYPRTTVSRRFGLPAAAVSRYDELDTPSFELVDLQRASQSTLTRALGLNASSARSLIALRRSQPLTSPDVLADHRRLLANLLKVHGRVFYAGEDPVHIVDVVPRGGFVLSRRPFALDVEFQNAGDARVVVVSVVVQWAGRPFVVERTVGPADARRGRVTVPFDRRRTLPVGRAEFRVALYRDDGAQSSFRRTVYVLPSNPLSLSLSPAGARVTGTWSARGDYHQENDTFLTECEITIANGDAGTVSMNRRVNWEFWDGPVGTGTRVENGSFDWPGAISVPGHGVWRGGVWFSSPRGSGIFGAYDRKEDMAISISMTAADGRTIRGEITTRVMLAWGVNVIKVGDFGTQEHIDLYDAVDQMRQIYEQRDITLRGVDRRIINNASAGSYTIINSEDEFRDLLEDWSVPNDFVDVYVVQQFQWSSYNGFAGDIPGPASKGGRKDGVAVDKSGYTDGLGTARLQVTTLAQLIGHEVGHYLGLQHLENTNNLMRSNTGNRGPDLNYTQYRTMFPHGFMVYL
jgi:hypothetical protein